VVPNPNQRRKTEGAERLLWSDCTVLSHGLLAQVGSRPLIYDFGMPLSMTPGSSSSPVQTSMPTSPSPSSEQLGTPNLPAIRFTRGKYFGASRFTHLLRLFFRSGVQNLGGPKNREVFFLRRLSRARRLPHVLAAPIRRRCQEQRRETRLRRGPSLADRVPGHRPRQPGGGRGFRAA
jgi:hypothetical protein